MLARVKNEMGAISLNEDLLKQIIGHAMEPYRGKAWIANYKGPSSDAIIKLGGYDAIEEIEFDCRENGVYVKLYLILTFGLSIRSTCIDIIGNIAADIQNSLELTVDDIEIEVTAVVSKKIARRDINYSYRGLKVSEEVNREKK